MSGRLVILPHKSWNVWNRDNREKVLKDEREHKEKQDLKSENNKKLLQEQNLDILRNETIQEKIVTPFRLFDDLEKKSTEQLTNDEYMKEKELKEAKSKKRDGTAAWGLGEGSVEVSNQKPWYETTKPLQTGDIGVIESRLSGRQGQRKAQLDPMLSFLPFIKPDPAVSGAASNLVGIMTDYNHRNGLKPTDQLQVSNIINTRTEEENSSSIKHKRNKEHKKQKRHHNNHIPGVSSLMTEKEAILIEMRRRQLEREGAESKKTTPFKNQKRG